MGSGIMKRSHKLAVWFAALAAVPVLMSPATAGPVVRIKNARALYNDMTSSLGIRAQSLPTTNRIYKELESNLPEHGVSPELTPSLDSIYKLSSGVCEVFARDTVDALSRNTGRWNDLTVDKAIAFTYQLTLDRAPNATELANVKGTIDLTRAGYELYIATFYNACLVTSSSLEFLVVAQ